jgi:uncharacterized membrane protein YhaH (DUF805 family)
VELSGFGRIRYQEAFLPNTAATHSGTPKGEYQIWLRNIGKRGNAMPRLVVPKHAAAGRFAAESLEEIPPDKYADRLVKYVPIESVTLYTVTDKMVIAFYGISQAGTLNGAPADSVLHIVPWLLFLLGLFGTPIYLYKRKLADQPWRMHAAISTLAFCCWVYTLGGSLILLHHWYHVVLAGIAAPVFTFVAGAFEPKAT